MRDNDGLNVEVKPIADGYILTPTGDVDLASSPVLRTEIAELQRRTPRRLVIDLSGVTYMDSSGVATLLEAMQIARKRGCRLVLCAIQPKVRAIFEIARLDMVFTIVDSTEAALTA